MSHASRRATSETVSRTPSARLRRPRSAAEDAVGRLFELAASDRGRPHLLGEDEPVEHRADRRRLLGERVRRRAHRHRARRVPVWSSVDAASISCPASQLSCSTRRVVRSIVCLLSSPGTRRPPGGWKWMPLGALARKSPAKQLGATPYARLNARVNASSEEVPRVEAAVVAGMFRASAGTRHARAAGGGGTRRATRPGSPRHASKWKRLRCARRASSARRRPVSSMSTRTSMIVWQPIFHPGSSSLAGRACPPDRFCALFALRGSRLKGGYRSVTRMNA